ncbi:MAG: phytoene/squalene synthase family protein [Akkermansiaceae bacterium]
MSRSFYLSLRFLPKGFREPTSVGYLLARLSDTIADAGEELVGARKGMLEALREAVFTGEKKDLVSIMEIKGVSDGEALLLKRSGDCLDALTGLPEWQQGAVKKVVKVITEGQGWDLTRFKKEGVVRLEDDAELRSYTYQVAGCVGNFWTELGFGLGEYSYAGREQMDEWGENFGRALQLINILRDVPEDLENGRCYLPGKGEATPEVLMTERGRWIAEAHQGLDDAERYADALLGKRIRFATLLPAIIGRETLRRLEGATWEEWQERVKVSRADVRRMMVKAVKFAL